MTVVVDDIDPSAKPRTAASAKKAERTFFFFAVTCADTAPPHQRMVGSTPAG
jgi:hypothetical protein